MKYLKQFLIIIAVSLVGELLHYFIPLPIPGSIYGIILMFGLLKCGILKLEDVDETGTLLVEIMPVMFIPVCAGLLDSWDIIKASWIKYLVLIIVSTIIVMVVSGKITQLVIRSKKETDVSVKERDCHE